MPLYCVQIDDGLRMQSEDLDTAAARVMELAAELDIKQEMRNRATVRSGVDIYRVRFQGWLKLAFFLILIFLVFCP